MDTKESILVESAAGEVELLVFRVGEERFGVNVAKVREIVQVEQVRPMPLSHPTVEGTFVLREAVHLLLNLKQALGGTAERPEPPFLVLVVEVNRKTLGLLVDHVEAIHRMSWAAIEPVPSLLTSHTAPLTGIAHVGEEVVQVLDLEGIICEVTGEAGDGILAAGSCAAPETFDRAEIRVLLAEDSPMIRGVVQQALEQAGYTGLAVAEDGGRAWTLLQEAEAAHTPFQLLVTDVEMPGVDGLHLLAQVRKEPSLAALPSIIYSSIVSEESARKGRSAGADAHITKFDMGLLVETMDRVVQERVRRG